MKFFFPDSQDQINPDFDFVKEVYPEGRIRQRDDLYAHEALGVPSYTGMLISKAIIDGDGVNGSRYSTAQRHRLRRRGVRRFFRLSEKYQVIGDCGAFTYVREKDPPFSVDEVVSFYRRAQVDIGVSVDHIILGYTTDEEEVSEEWRYRQAKTLELAKAFWERSQASDCSFTPMGVAQGWSPESYRHSVEQLQLMGYEYIGLGGMVPLKTPEILASLEAVSKSLRPETKLHLFGVTRCKHVESFRKFGVVSFDSTSPFLQAFKDNKDNYYTRDGSYMAVRVPQVDGNPRVKRMILSGQLDQRRAWQLEQQCLETLRRYDEEKVSLNEAMEALLNYEAFLNIGPSRESHYRRTLGDRPWKQCPCNICQSSGIEVILLRGAERNKRRGFHNIFVFNQRFQDHFHS